MRIDRLDMEVECQFMSTAERDWIGHLPREDVRVTVVMLCTADEARHLRDYLVGEADRRPGVASGPALPEAGAPKALTDGIVDGEFIEPEGGHRG